MIDPKAFDDFAKILVDAVPPSLRQFQNDMEKNARAALQSALSKLDVVTREEFEVQQSVLERTRAKLDALEKQVVELEKLVGAKRRKGTDKSTDPETDAP